MPKKERSCSNLTNRLPVSLGGPFKKRSGLAVKMYKTPRLALAQLVACDFHLTHNPCLLTSLRPSAVKPRSYIGEQTTFLLSTFPPYKRPLFLSQRTVVNLVNSGLRSWEWCRRNWQQWFQHNLIRDWTDWVTSACSKYILDTSLMTVSLPTPSVAFGTLSYT